jgi:hypothetical protein
VQTPLPLGPEGEQGEGKNRFQPCWRCGKYAEACFSLSLECFLAGGGDGSVIFFLSNSSARSISAEFFEAQIVCAPKGEFRAKIR